MLLIALVLVLQLGSYSWVQCQETTSATTTNSSELQRLREDVTEVKESIKDLSNLLQAFGDQLAQIRESLGDVERKVTLEVKQCIQNEVASLSNAISSLNCNDDDETLTCNPPRITHLGFTHGSRSSTLTCISTGSPATTVTWMRDGQPLTIDGSTYFLTHTVNYRRNTTYENVLTIKAAVSNIYRHTYTCTVVNALGSDSEILTATPPPTVSISPPDGPPTAGESFSLTCSVRLGDGGSLTEDLIVQWEAPVDINIDNDIQVITTDSTGTRTSVLQFTLLRTSHGGNYTCKATTTTGTDMASETLTVQISPPTLSVSRDPDASVTLRHGDNLTLTCYIKLDPNPAVDSNVVVTGKLEGQEGSNSTTVMATAGEYKILLYIPSLRAVFSDVYTCTATVEPGSGVMYAQSSESSHSLNITVELLVDVSVSYTPPPGFTPGPNEYRAASGPVTVTCTAVGGTGPVSYQWSSTCRECPFQTAIRSSVSLTVVHSGVTGIHTCTVSDSKIHGSRRINFNVVGAGIHVNHGVSIGSLPNNDMVISTPSSTTGTAFGFLFFCVSDSMMSNVGMLIGPNGTAVTTAPIFSIAHILLGILRVYSQNALTTSDQGVYTCRIPLQSGELRDINVGLYPSGFSSPPSIQHLDFTHGPTSFTLTCISTGSPATTVTWMRDGQPLTIDGSTYFMTHTVNYRRNTTYENVLTINAAVSNIYRHTYTCTVVNALGSDSKTLTATPPPKVSISPPDGPPTAGESFSLTCSVILEDGGPLTEDLIVHWEAPVDINPANDIQMNTTDSTGTRTSVLQFTLLRTSHGGNYTCKATTTTGTDMATEIITVQKLLVNIRVSYTPPPGFIPGPNEYRAASGPVRVTCTAVGGTGPVSYQWSSTCRDCPFQTATRSSVYRTFVHSGHTGIHTCTAMDSKIHGSRSIIFNVVGAGIHVYVGASVGLLPNNGMVISRPTTPRRHSFSFQCHSDSMLSNVGILIGPDGTSVTTGDVFHIVHLLRGALRVHNTQNDLTTSDQGVYTCRIPLQSGELRDMNVGIYPNGFSTSPSITHLRFTHGPTSSTLTCISTGSPATTVTWMRDRQPLTIDGSTYQLTQTVTNRSLSTYENVLTINAAVSTIYRHTYTCTVVNVLGSDSKAVLASPRPRVAISPTGTLTAGKATPSDTYTCEVTVEPRPRSVYVQGSRVHASLDITVATP